MVRICRERGVWASGIPFGPWPARPIQIAPAVLDAAFAGLVSAASKAPAAGSGVPGTHVRLLEFAYDRRPLRHNSFEKEDAPVQWAPPAFRHFQVPIARRSSGESMTVYIRPNGDDENDGSEKAPVKSANRAIAIANRNKDREMNVLVTDWARIARELTAREWDEFPQGGG